MTEKTEKLLEIDDEKMKEEFWELWEEFSEGYEYDWENPKDRFEFFEEILYEYGGEDCIGVTHVGTTELVNLNFERVD